MKRFPHYHQMDQMDCGPTCLRMIARHYGRELDQDALRDQCHLTREGVSLAGMANAAEGLGMKSLAVQLPPERIQEVPLPCIAHWRQRHFVVVHRVDGRHVHVADPAHGLIKYTRKEFCEGWLGGAAANDESAGLLLLLEPTPDFYARDLPEAEPRRGLRFLLPYFRPHHALFTQLWLGLLVGSVILLGLPFLTQTIVDHGIRYDNLNFVYLILAAQLMLFVSQTAVDWFRNWLLLHVGSRVHISLISEFLRKLMRLPVAFFDSKTIGDLLQRLQDHDRVESFLSASTLTMLFSVVTVALFGVVLALYSQAIFAVFVVGTGLYLLWVLAFMKRRAKLDYQRFDQASGNQSSIVQLINGMQEIKLNNSERRRRWEWEAIQVRLFRISVQGLSLLQSQTAGGNFINELKNILITVLSAKAVIDGHMTLGQMLAVQYMIGQLNVPVRNFATFIQSWQDARLSLDRLAEIHGRADEEPNEAPKLRLVPHERDIRISDDLTFRYGGPQSQAVLEKVNLAIPSGKVTAIVGASGSGKTTLLKLLLKFYAPEQGRIQVGNFALNDIHATAWRQRCGVVMQDGYIFADTIGRNITESESSGAIDRERLLRAVHVANLDELIERLPQGFNTRIGASGITLSGGQRQRVLIARAVYKNPDFIFFDEATSALDAHNERAIVERLEQFCEGRTVIVIAHRLSTVRNADQIVVLERGRVVEAGGHSELTANRGAYYSLVKNQLELGQ